MTVPLTDSFLILFLILFSFFLFFFFYKILALRKLSTARKLADPTPEDKDIIRQYHDYGSNAYAPTRRDGAAGMRSVRPIAASRSDASSLESLVDMQRTLPKSTLEPKLDGPVDRMSQMRVNERRYVS